MRTILLIFAFLLFEHALHAQQPIDAMPDRTRKRVEILIEQLASRNNTPPILGNARRGEDQTIRFPESYDKSRQVLVYNAIQTLLAEDDAAIDLLLEHEEDPRYSYSVNSYVDYNVTVGEACRTIAEAMLIGFENELHVVSRSQFGLFPPRETSPADKSAMDLATYWRMNKSRGAAKVQIEAIDAMLEYFKNADAQREPPWHPDARPLPAAEFNRRRDLNIKTLIAMRQLISETGKRYRTNTIEGAHYCIFGLPWSARKFNK